LTCVTSSWTTRMGSCRDWFHSYGLSVTLLGLNGHKESAHNGSAH
jgi:hypothetical protein